MSRFLSFFVVLYFLFGCTNDNEEDFFGDCDLESITYDSTIQGIIASKCISCHGTGNTNGPVLEHYTDVIIVIDDIASVIVSETDVMPPVTSLGLTDCEKLQIQNWIDDGLLE